MATLAQFLGVGRDYTIEYLGALLQPHHKEVLYVIDSILYVDHIEICIAGFKNSNAKLLLVEHYCNEHCEWWELKEVHDDSRSGREWWFFRKDIVDALLGI